MNIERRLARERAENHRAALILLTVIALAWVATRPAALPPRLQPDVHARLSVPALAPAPATNAAPLTQQSPGEFAEQRRELQP